MYQELEPRSFGKGRGVVEEIYALKADDAAREVWDNHELSRCCQTNFIWSTVVGCRGKRFAC